MSSYVTCVLQKMSGGAVSNTPSCLNINWRSRSCLASVSSLLGQKGIFCTEHRDLLYMIVLLYLHTITGSGTGILINRLIYSPSPNHSQEFQVRVTLEMRKE